MARGKPVLMWRWRVRHPWRYLRSLVPIVAPLRARAAIVRAVQRETKNAAGEPERWLAELRTMPAIEAVGAADSPLVSVVVVAYGNRVMTELCVESILRLTRYPAFEVIVVDNASGDGTAEALRALASDSRLKLILRDSNAGFAAATNEGFTAATGHVICIVNNDIVVTPHWLDDLVDALRSDARAGLVGPVTNSCGNEARVPADYDSLDGMLRAADGRRERHRGSSFEIPMLALYCAAMWRRVWEEVGPLDERFDIGMFEDDDYARRLRERGYRLACCEDVFIHHWGAAAFGQLGLERYFEIWEANRARFRDKWRGRAPIAPPR